MRDAGFTRRPTWHSLPGDDEPTPVAPVGMAYVPLVMTQAMRDVTDSEGWTWEDLLAAAEAITESQYEKLAAAAAPVAPTEWTDAKLRGIACDYFPDSVHWPAAMLCLRHLLMEQSKFGAPAAPAEPTHLHRADGTLSGVFVEPVASEAAAVAADLRNWLDFLPGHAQPTIERAVRLLETRP